MNGSEEIIPVLFAAREEMRSHVIDHVTDDDKPKRDIGGEAFDIVEDLANFGVLVIEDAAKRCRSNAGPSGYGLVTGPPRPRERDFAEGDGSEMKRAEWPVFFRETMPSRSDNGK